MTTRSPHPRPASRRRALLGAFAMATPLTGCAVSSGPEITYHEDISPILRKNCVTCHQQDGFAPFPLTAYAEVKGRAGAIADATAQRRMPPIPAVADGSCQTFKDAHWLDNAEIERIARWSAEGAPEGDPVR